MAYIERESAIKSLLNDSPEQVRYSREDAANCIRYMDAYDVAPVRHGRWISWEEAGNFVPSPDRHECSVCHDAAQVLTNGFELLSDYCPNCGAKMDLED